MLFKVKDINVLGLIVEKNQRLILNFSIQNKLLGIWLIRNQLTITFSKKYYGLVEDIGFPSER